ncbi:hypothetical protein [Flagellimonas myxillae]|uniref:hypothetical protein n=1 Tax=Flagellimonas myxillae TaxID=2942214 RepID=UPI00201F05A4|nr:hypothetical protein [Muricauda myxillae]MCL6267658.1 hypothetical protein [Muricauda myxillae]
MIALNIVSTKYMTEFLDPMHVLIGMVALLVTLLLVSKFFFWLAPEIKLPKSDTNPGKLICQIPDVLMQKKGQNLYVDYSIKSIPTASLPGWMKVVAVVLAILLAFTYFGDLLRPFGF